MRRFCSVWRLAPLLVSSVAVRAVGSSAFSDAPGQAGTGGGANSFTDVLAKDDGAAASSEAHPLLYHVPALSARTVGRDAEVTALWQNLLSGRRCQVLVGVDGIGKSTVASEFCDAARRSGRFTCIQWFNGQHALDSQLERFFVSMRGRRERDVLLVLDDVADPKAALALLPQHQHVYVIMTSNNTNAVHCATMSVTPTLPLSPKAAEELAVEVDGADAADAMNAVLDTLGFVPLLVNIASLLVVGGVVSAGELLNTLTTREVMKDNALSISKALGVLLELAVAQLSQAHPQAAKHLAKLSCFHLGDISDVLISAVCGDDGAQLVVEAAQLGIFSPKWEDSAFAIHPSVAAVLRDGGGLSDADLGAAATALKGMWPRRWRGMGSHLAYNLVWHSHALNGHFAARGLPLTPDLVECMDRSATFLAHSEARDLAVAASLWYAVFQQQQRQRTPTADSVRIARECGRLLHYLRDERAHAVLQAAHDAAAAVHGPDAAETALIMGCLAPYLEASQASADRLSRCVELLEARLSSVDVVLSKEETKMLLETMFVLTVCHGQILEEMGKTVPDALWASLESVKERLRPFR